MTSPTRSTPATPPFALRLKLWLDGAFVPPVCDLARGIQGRMRRARDQLLTFASFPDGSRRTTTPASATSDRR